MEEIIMLPWEQTYTWHIYNVKCVTHSKNIIFSRKSFPLYVSSFYSAALSTLRFYLKSPTGRTGFFALFLLVCPVFESNSIILCRAPLCFVKLNHVLRSMEITGLFEEEKIWCSTKWYAICLRLSFYLVGKEIMLFEKNCYFKLLSSHWENVTNDR